MILPNEALREPFEALRLALRQAGRGVVEQDWGHSLGYGVPWIFAVLWPQPTHLTVALPQGSRLPVNSRRLLGQGPALRTLRIRSLEDLDAEVLDILREAARWAIWSGGT